MGHKVRNSILNRSGNANPAHEAQIMSTIARFFWLGDCKGASRLAETSPFAASLLEVFPNSVSLKDPNAFSDRLANLKTVSFDNLLNQSMQANQTPPGPASGSSFNTPLVTRKQKSYKSAICRLARLWTPFDKRLVLDGVRTPQGIKTDLADKVSALAQAWAPTFAAKSFDLAAAEEFFKDHAHAYTFIDAFSYKTTLHKIYREHTILELAPKNWFFICRQLINASVRGN